MDSLPEQIRAAMVQALARKAKAAEAVAAKKEAEKTAKFLDGLPGKVLTFLKAEKSTLTGVPVEGATTYELGLAFPEEKQTTLRWALWQLSKKNLAYKTEEVRQPERARPPLAVWRAL